MTITDEILEETIKELDHGLREQMLAEADGVPGLNVAELRENPELIDGITLAMAQSYGTGYEAGITDTIESIRRIGTAMKQPRDAALFKALADRLSERFSASSN